MLLTLKAAATIASTPAVKLAGIKVVTGLVTCKVTVNASVTAGVMVDGVVVNGEFDNASDSMP